MPFSSYVTTIHCQSRLICAREHIHIMSWNHLRDVLKFWKHFIRKTSEITLERLMFRLTTFVYGRANIRPMCTNCKFLGIKFQYSHARERDIHFPLNAQQNDGTAVKCSPKIILIIQPATLAILSRT